jgi:hypothetical protein
VSSESAGTDQPVADSAVSRLSADELRASQALWPSLLLPLSSSIVIFDVPSEPAAIRIAGMPAVKTLGELAVS